MCYQQISSLFGLVLANLRVVSLTLPALPLTCKSAIKLNKNSTTKDLWSAFKQRKEATIIDFINGGEISFNVILKKWNEKEKKDALKGGFITKGKA